MKQAISTLGIIAVAIAALIVWQGIYVVKEGTQAVVTQFGRPVGEPKTTAGLKFKTPFIQDVRFFPAMTLIWDGEPNQIATNDKTFIFIDTTARWRISDALRFLQAVGTEAKAQTILDDIIDGTVRDLVNKHDLTEIIRSSDWSPDYMSSDRNDASLNEAPKFGRDKISELVLEAAGSTTHDEYGITLLDIMFKRVNYIDSVRTKVYDRMISERKRIADEKRSTGEGLKAEILGKVERELKEITSAAKQEAVIIKGKADAEATRIYGEAYSKHPEFYSFQKTLESYRDTATSNTTLILDSKSEFFGHLESSKPLSMRE